MPNFDGTVDNTYRPDFESSQRRVREERNEARLELREALTALTRRVTVLKNGSDADGVTVQSTELSFVPSRRAALEPYGAQTQALIRRAIELEEISHGSEVADLVSDWKIRDRMQSAHEKQAFLEPLIEAVRRDPQAHEAKLIFLMLVFEPIRRRVTKILDQARSGLHADLKDVDWTNRQEARLIAHVERERLYDLTRQATLEAVFRYPPLGHPRLFLWFRETIAHRSLDFLRAELPEADSTQVSRAEADAIQSILAGVSTFDAPASRDTRGLAAWRQQINMRSVFATVESFYEYDPVKEICRIAIGRLPNAQRDVIDQYFFEEANVAAIAQSRGSTESTVYNLKARAQSRLRGDNVFFSALCGVGRVRDTARASELKRKYPTGRLPDGRRLVHIGIAA